MIPSLSSMTNEDIKRYYGLSVMEDGAGFSIIDDYYDTNRPRAADALRGVSIPTKLLADYVLRGVAAKEEIVF